MSRKVGTPLKFLMKARKQKPSNIIQAIIPSGKAMPGPPLGPLLGKHGINISAFCKDFNTRTSIYKEGIPLPCKIKVKLDRSYDLLINNPTTTYFLFQAAGIQRGQMDKSDASVGKVSIKHIYEIAKVKGQDRSLITFDPKMVCEMMVSSARQMGIEVVRDLDPEGHGEYLEEKRLIAEKELEDLTTAKEQKLLRK